jgi:hypothetical protein
MELEINVAINDDQIPEGITVGTETGNINRKIKENMKKYLDGDVSALSDVILYSRKRHERLCARKFIKKSS